MNDTLARQFLSGYFHEDWREVDGSEADAVAAYAESGVAPSILRRLAKELETIARRAASDEALEEQLFVDYGCFYSPGSDGFAAREWLRSVASLLREEAEG